METPPGPARAERSRPAHTPVALRANSQTPAVDTPASPSPRHSNPPDRPRGEYDVTPAAPIAKPTFRLQGGEIILEEAGASPYVAAAAAAPGSLPNRQQQRQPAAQPGSREPKPTTERELRALASRTTTVQAQPSLRQNTLHSAAAEPAANGGDARLPNHHPQPPLEGGEEEAAASSEHASRIRYRPTLTTENVQQLTKLEQYSARPDPTERMWRWLEDAGPPYEGSPSVGVPSKAAGPVDSPVTVASHSSKRFWCFSCFGGGR